jgi:hypothetical protein
VLTGFAGDVDDSLAWLARRMVDGELWFGARGVSFTSLIVVGGLVGEHCGLAVESCFKCCGCKQAALQSPPGCLVLGGTWLLNMLMCTFRGWSTMGYILILMEGLVSTHRRQHGSQHR